MLTLTRTSDESQEGSGSFAPSGIKQDDENN